MIQQDRQFYNEQFTEEKYKNFLNDIISTYNHTPPFKIAETPIYKTNPKMGRAKLKNIIFSIVLLY